LPCMR